MEHGQGVRPLCTSGWARLWVVMMLSVCSLVVCSLCMTGCMGGAGASESPEVSAVTGVDAVSELFPGLEGAEAVEAEMLAYGGTSPRDALPSPTDYLYRGYVTLSDETTSRYAATYGFVDVQTPRMSFETLVERDGNWGYSHEFCKAIMRPGLVGSVWLDEATSTLLFSVGTM